LKTREENIRFFTRRILEIREEHIGKNMKETLYILRSLRERSGPEVDQ